MYDIYNMINLQSRKGIKITYFVQKQEDISYEEENNRIVT